MTRQTSEFLKILERQNAAIAAREAAKAETPGEDPIRLQREQERREKYGQLRAREQPSKQRKGATARSVFGYTDLT